MMKYEGENSYPEPGLRRKIWQSLNGEWQFKFGDDGNYDRIIRVPYAYQSEASGIGDPSRYEILWYKRKFTLSQELRACKTTYLNFLAVDYECWVFVNGKFVTAHEGGYGSFGVDIKPYLTDEKEQKIEVRVYDPMTKTNPRGKQNWAEGQQRCWYHCTSGIWQSVWLDGANGDYAIDVKFVTDVRKTQVCAYVETDYGKADEVVAVVKTPHGNEKTFSSTTVQDKTLMLNMSFDKPDCIDDIHLWTVDHPKLYETKLYLKRRGEVLDEVETYFAFRKIHTEKGRVYINDVPIELRMILNQGYWEGYGMTAPSAESYKEDILIAKEMGFNGMRVHQKVDDPWLYYYADTLGFYVWAETPSAYAFGPPTTKSILNLQADLVKRVYNHPSVIAYVPFNESWGVKEIQHNKQEQSLAKCAYWLIKSLDDSRLVITNDGWENLELSDIIGVHDYSKYGDEFPTKFKDVTESLVPAGRRIMVQGDKIVGQPIMLTEFGGVALSGDSGWGYNGAEKDVEAFMRRFKRLYQNVSACDFCGWCYTQLTDVEQETNGLLDGNHKPKFDLKKIRAVIEKYGKIYY